MAPGRTYAHAHLCVIALGLSASTMARAQTYPVTSNNKDAVTANWSTVLAVIADRCTTCHSSPDPLADLDLTVPEHVRAQALSGRLLERLNDPDDPMPPSGMLPESTRALLEAWVNAGASIEAQEQPDPSRAVTTDDEHRTPTKELTPVKPIDINTRGFEFLERMQGHWIGHMNLMGQDMPWFAFDYRAIAPSHVHGIFEGGTMGNLMTSFFHARVRGTDTLIARNGGILNGIYRMSYFVLDDIAIDGSATRYRFVDAIGGAEIMWMALEFDGNQLEWEAHTSRMGEQPTPSRHMHFRATRRHTTLAEPAATVHGFPDRQRVLDLPSGLPTPDWGDFGPATSASYMWQSKELSPQRMGVLAGDPLRIEHLTHLAKLTLTIDRMPAIEKARLLVYLSNEPLTNSDGALRTEHGLIDEAAFDTVLLFPEIVPKQNEFTLMYLHPGTTYLTVVADLDGDRLPGVTDAISPSRHIVLAPGAHETIHVDDIE
ncbi:MAG: hypothetical protein AAF432_09720 [Planctomycetota bacterium]